MGLADLPHSPRGRDVRAKKGALRMGIRVRVFRGLVVAGWILGSVPLALSGIVAGTTAVRAQAETASLIRSYFRPAPGHRLDAAKINEGLKALLATGLFEDVKIRHERGRLVVHVIENLVINKIAFEGNKKIKDAQLKTEIQSRQRGPLSRPTVQADVQRIVEIYQRNGRFDVTVVPNIIRLPNGRVNLVFAVTEGPKTTVKDIVFVGNHAYSSFRLKDVIKTTESHFLLSLLQTGDIYDPDRIEADRDLLRRFYLKHGYADVRIVSAVAEYDPARKGFVITFTIDEGVQYRFGKVNLVSNVRAIDPGIVTSELRTRSGDVYNAEAVQKSIENMTIEAARHGYAFVAIRPSGDRDFQRHVVNITYVIEDGPHVYIERINITGNTRTRDYVIRREFDIAEGDAYNRALVDRAERRLKNLDYFKTVKITTEPGSAPDRIVIDVDVVEKSTGQFSIAGGYSTIDGFIGEVSVSERNLLGRGQYAKVAAQVGQRVRGFQVSFAEPYFLGYRLLWGIDLFVKQNLASQYVSYDSKTAGFSTRFGFALRQDLALQTRYSFYRQEITLPDVYNNCQFSSLTPGNGGPGVTQAGEAAGLDTIVNVPNGCYADGEASLAVRKELAAGAVNVSSIGYTLAYTTLDNSKSPTSGTLVKLKQDFAGVGGDVNYLRTTVEGRYYHEVLSDVVGLFRVQAGHITALNGQTLRMLDHFQMGPNLVRGFAPAGLGPRDLTDGTLQDALGGSMFWGATLELQVPFFFLPKSIGMRGALYTDAGSLWNYQGPTSWSVTGETITPVDSSAVRASVGVGIIWDSPFGPLRFDLAFPYLKQSYDKTQIFRFSGGTSF